MANIIEILLEDHLEIRRLFDAYEADPEGTFGSLKRELEMHTEMEEAVLYPAMMDFAEDKVEHAREEHDEADKIVARLEKNPTSKATFAKLRDAILHHVDEEEEELFPLTAENLGDSRLDELGVTAEQLRQRRIDDGQ